MEIKNHRLAENLFKNIYDKRLVAKIYLQKEPLKNSTVRKIINTH